jgi:uncharacterized phiE125 gp8 family phage protein
VVGYGDTHNQVPEAIRQAISLLVAYWYEQRHAVNLGEHPISEAPYSVKALLEPYRVWSV